MLGTLQGGILLSRLAVAFVATEQNTFTSALREIKANRPVFAILGSITAVTVVSIISSLVSIIPHSSWWGRSPAGFESGEYTFLMYVILSLSTFVTIRESNDKAIVWKFLSITGVLAALVGLFQFFGWSPLDISSTHSARLTGTNGNPIFFGAMLVVLAPITLATLITKYQTAPNDVQRWWLAALGATSFLFALSIIGTGSRGPWLGVAAVGITAFILIVTNQRFRTNLVPMATITVLAVLGALLAAFVDLTPPKEISAAEEERLGSSSVRGIARTDTMSVRFRYWKLATNAAINREPVPHTTDAPKIVRLLFGYGPDMFRFAGTYFSDSTTFTRRLTAAHNDPINRLFEQGFLGFLSWVSLWISIAYGSLVLVRRSLRSSANITPWIPILLAAAFAGRFVEQLFGSPTPGGVIVFWLLAGGLASLLMANPTKNFAPAKISPVTQYITYSAVAIITLASIVLAWDRGMNYLIANQMASFQFRSTVVTGDEAIERLEGAVALAPDVVRYWHDLAEIEHGRAASLNNPLAKAEALSRAYEYDLKAHTANPLEVNSAYKLAFSAWEAGNAGRPELRQKAIDLYVYITEIIPSDALAQERLQILNEFMSYQPE